ncbi:MAG TPA: pyridoxal-phosphate dependent enzyme [Steroidobacteraceae bacterium]
MPSTAPSPELTAEVSLRSIQAARERIATHVRLTPVLENEALNALARARLYFKCENFQEVGAFKARGATNAVFALPEERLHAGVVTHSSGNHGAALARAARLRGVRAQIVMPQNSSRAKLDAVRAFGGEILLCAPTLAAREARAAGVVAETGAVFIHPYDDPAVISGQGTIALELLEQVPELDWLLLPVGGGGLTSGVAVAGKALRPALRVVGVEPLGADDAQRSFVSGILTRPQHPVTIADGLRGALSERTFELIRRHVDTIVTVSEAAIVQSMRSLWQQLKIIVEPSAAVPYAAVQSGQLEVAGMRVGIVLTGGNVDLDALPW